jgi:hypothetical protein
LVQVTRSASLVQVTATRPQVAVGTPSVVTHNALTNRSDANQHPASAITFTPAGSIAATTVQTAIAELDTEKQPLDADLTAISALTTTAYGRGALTLADAPAFASYAGVPLLATAGITGTLTLSKTGTTARTVTFPDQAITVAGKERDTGWTALQTFSAGLAPTFVGFGIAAGAPAYAEGRVYWDATDHTLAVMTDTADVTLQVGQEFYVRATNKTGAPLTNGTAVYVDGAQGQRPTVAKALATATPSDRTIGLCTADIANNATGYVTTAGLVRGIDTSAWIEGTELFVSTTVAGELTSTRPTAPDHSVIIGIVTYQHNINGTIQVKVHTGATLSQLHDVKITSIANKDAMRYVSTNSRWENTDQAGWRDTASTWTALQTFSTGLTVSAGTTALQAVTCTTLTASGTVIVPNGSVSDPGVRMASEATGLYRYGAAVLGIAIAGSATLNITAPGGDYGTAFQLQAPAAGRSYFYNSVNDGSLEFFPGTSATTGGQIRLYASAHATKASYIEFITANTVRGYFDATGLMTLNVGAVISAGTMTTPSTTQAILAGGKLYCGDTSATSIQTAGGITAAGSVVTSTSSNANIGFTATASVAGTSSAALNCVASDNGNALYLTCLSTTYAGSMFGTARAGTCELLNYGGLSAGLKIGNSTTGIPITFGIGPIEVFEITSLSNSITQSLVAIKATSTLACYVAGGAAIGATALLASERLRVAGGTMGTPGATDVLLAAGRIYCGNTSAASIQTAGGVGVAKEIVMTSSATGAVYWGATTTTTGATRTYGNGSGAQIFEKYNGSAWVEIGRFA